MSEFVKRLRKAGCTFHRHGSGHDIWILPDGTKFSVPRHKSQEVSQGLLDSQKELLGL